MYMLICYIYIKCIAHIHAYIYTYTWKGKRHVGSREGSKPSEKITLTYMIFIGEGRQETQAGPSQKNS